MPAGRRAPPPSLCPAAQVSYAEFDADIDRFGAGLVALGLGPESGVVSVAIAEPYIQYLATAALARLDIASSPANDDGADLRLIDHDAPPRQEGGAEGTPRLSLSRDWIVATLAAEPRPLPNLLRDPLKIGRVMLSSTAARTPRRVGFTWRRIEIGSHLTLHSYCAGKLGTWIPLAGIDSMMGLSLVMGAWSVGAAAANAIPRATWAAGWRPCPPGVIALTPMHLRQMLAGLPDGFRPRPAWRVVCGGSLPAAGRGPRGAVAA
jgi:hypothetical protein